MVRRVNHFAAGFSLGINTLLVSLLLKVATLIDFFFVAYSCYLSLSTIYGLLLTTDWIIINLTFAISTRYHEIIMRLINLRA